MAGPFDLTGVNIEDSYQRILQTPDGINIYDGTGSAFTVTAVAAPAGPNQSIQFNDNGATSGSANFIFNKTTNTVSLTGSLYLAGTTPSIYFSGSGAASRLTWNDVDGTLNLGLKGGVASSELGQGLVTRVVNKTSPLIDLLATNYQVVVIGGAQGQRLSIRLAQADNDANSAGTLGVVAENIDRNQEGFVVTVGLLKNRDTTGALQGETWNDGDILYLSPTVAGQMTNVKPQAPQHTVIVGYVEYAHQNNGKIYVKIDNGYEIDELHNVRITTASLTAGQLLVRSGSNNGGVWINSNQLTGSYGLTGSLTFVSGGLTGSLFGTSSHAITASYVDLSSIALNSESLGTTPIVVIAATTAVLPRTPFYNNGTAGVGAFLSASLVGTLGNIDGTSLSVGDTILVKNQAAQLQNGIYEVISTGSASTRYLLSRSLFSDETSEFDPQVVLVASGSSNRGLVYSQNTNNPVVGTSPIVYLQQIGVFMTQVGTGTQNEYQIPWYTTTARQLSRGSSNFRYINVTSGTTVTTSSLVLTGSLFVTGGIPESGGTGHILTYNTQSGRFSFTASSAIGGGGSGVTINNNVDNYILTATGVANTIQGEPNFSFSGSTLTVSGSTIISGSGLVVSGSIQVDGGLTGSLFGTSSWAVSASQAISSSYALSSSYATSASYALSSSYSLSSSYAESSSYSLSSSYSDTASYALNGLPPGTSGQILQIDNSNQYQLQTLINDTAAVTSIDFENRTLNNDNGNILIDYGRYGQLYDLSGVESMNFGDLRTLSDSGGVLSIHYEIRTLNDISGLYSIDYANRTLYYPNGTTPALSYGVQDQVNITGSVFVSGSLTVSGSSTFTNIGPAIFSGSVSISGSTQGGGSGHVLTYNTASGELFYTASSAIGGGGGPGGNSIGQLTGDVTTPAASSPGQSVAATIKPNLRSGSFGVTIDGNGGVIAVGQRGYVTMPYDGTIIDWELLADVTGTCNIDVRKSTFASFPTQTTITGSAPITMSAAQKAASSTLTGWTTSFNQGDVFGFTVVSATSITRLYLSLTTLRS